MNESTYKLINIILNILNLFFLILLGYFGYRINVTLADMQLNADKRTIAKETKELWENLSNLEQKAFEFSGEFESAVTDCTIKIAELLNVLESKKDLLGKKEMIMLDPEIMAQWSAYLSSHAKLMALTTKIGIEYDNARLKFSPVIKELNVEQWKSFFNQTKEVVEWKQIIFKQYAEVYNYLYDSVFENKNKIDLQKAKVLGYGIGRSMALSTPPYLKGLIEMKEKNLKYWENKF